MTLDVIPGVGRFVGAGLFGVDLGQTNARTSDSAGPIKENCYRQPFYALSHFWIPAAAAPQVNTAKADFPWENGDCV